MDAWDFVSGHVFPALALLSNIGCAFTSAVNLYFYLVIFLSPRLSISSLFSLQSTFIVFITTQECEKVLSRTLDGGIMML